MTATLVSLVAVKDDRQQGYHFFSKTWKPGKVRKFQNGQENVRECAKRQEKLKQNSGILCSQVKVFATSF